MNYSIIVITTNLPKRFDVLKRTLDSMDSYAPNVDKILSVDVFANIPFDIKFFQQFIERGWRIVYGPQNGRNSMAMNQLRALTQVNTDWVLYSEDDVTFNGLMSLETFHKVIDHDNIGFISGNNDVLEVNQSLQFINDQTSYIQIEDAYLFKKIPVNHDPRWYLNFPSCYIRASHLKMLLEYAMTHYRGQPISIEDGLSRAWFTLGMDKQFNCYSHLVRMPSFPVETFREFYECSYLNFWFNDESTQIPPVNDKASMWF